MLTSLLNMNTPVRWYHGVNVMAFLCLLSQVQTTTMCISVSLSGSVVLGCLFAPKIHIILFQPQKNVTTLRVATTRFSVTTGPGSSFSQGTVSFMISVFNILSLIINSSSCLKQAYWSTRVTHIRGLAISELPLEIKDIDQNIQYCMMAV